MDGVLCVLSGNINYYRVSETMSDEWNDLNQTQILGGGSKKKPHYLGCRKVAGKSANIAKCQRGAALDFPQKKFSSK